ncbi:hypothetical protein NQ315_011089 [Exocentrus adspersus]|uniref:Major facilitator superfamily (MFS) profile domain-containing protein n=1 Tax=Exocentrus adspersus TaxID=1586481 RepID=A0AAV8VX73_9CUCU|nr:hypothetical protein NQ315_011089 [Exocentrus adspersus]
MEEYKMKDMFKGTLTQVFAAVFGTLFAISDGMVTGWTAPMIPYLISEESHIKTTKREAEWLEPALLMGAFCGLPTTIYFTQKIGRKKSLLLASAVSLMAWIAVLFADKIIYICAARFFSGMAGNMAFVSAPMYVAEIADQKIRGFLSSIIYLMLLFGCVVVYIVGPYLPYYASPVIGAGIVITELMVFSFVPESPYYLLWKGKPEKAKKSLEYFRPGIQDVEDELKSIAEGIQRQSNDKGKMRDLFSGGNCKAFLIMAVLGGGQNLCGINVVLMNLHLILREAGSIYLNDSLTGIVFSVVMLITASAASFFVDKYGRKVLLVTSASLTGITLLLIAIYFNVKFVGYEVAGISWIPIVTVMAYAFCYKIGLGMVPIVITSEIFATNVKAIGMTLADAMFVCWGIVSLQVYQWLSDPFGIHVPFYLFSISAFLLALFTVFCIPETKGKTLDEIQKILNGIDLGKDLTEKSAVEIPLMELKA